MKPNEFDGQGAAARSLYAHQFDGLVIVYFDAEGLRRGFQLWLGWPGGADRLRNCLPICLDRNGATPEWDRQPRKARRDALVLLCPSAEGGFSSGNIGALSEILQHESTVRRGLVVLFATRRSCATWRRHWPLPKSFEFSLGCYTVGPAPRTGGPEKVSNPLRYDLQAVSLT